MTGGYTGLVDFGGGPKLSHIPEEAEDVYYPPAEDIFAVRFDGEGNYLWDVVFGNLEAQQGTAVGIEPSGNVLVAGSASGPLPFAPSPLEDTPYYDGFVVALSR